MIKIPLESIKVLLLSGVFINVLHITKLRGTSFLGLCLISNSKKEVYIYLVDLIALALVGSCYLIGKDYSSIERTFEIEKFSSYLSISVGVSLLLENNLSVDISDFSVWDCIFEDCDELELVGVFK